MSECQPCRINPIFCVNRYLPEWQSSEAIGEAFGSLMIGDFVQVVLYPKGGTVMASQFSPILNRPVLEGIVTEMSGNQIAIWSPVIHSLVQEGKIPAEDAQDAMNIDRDSICAMGIMPSQEIIRTMTRGTRRYDEAITARNLDGDVFNGALKGIISNNCLRENVYFIEGKKDKIVYPIEQHDILS
jgi:hypothetical protein